MKDRPSLLTHIYRLKLIIMGLAFVLLGLVFSLLADWLAATPNASHLLVAILRATSDVLLVTGAIGIAVDFFTGRDKEAADTERLRTVLKDAAPDIRDAVVAGFAETPDNMRSVATTETLDKLATNALALRLGDEKFAREIYEGLLAQAIRTPERWHDVDVSIRLSAIAESSTYGAAQEPLPEPATAVTARRHEATTQPQLFDVVVTWEYTLTPSSRIQRLTSTNSLAEFNELLEDAPATSAWYIGKTTADAREKDTFEVLSFSVEGVELPVRRTVRKSGQTYSVDLGDAAVANATPVRIRRVYRTIVRQSGHRFRLAITQPTQGLRVLLDYTDAGLAELKVNDLISSARPAQVKFLPERAPAKQVEVSVPGWLLPQAEVSFVWTLTSEADAGTTPSRSRAA